MDLAQISQVDNALLQACLEGNEDALAHAVRHGALATRARDAMGATPLHMACLGGHLDIAAWCADQGLDVATADAQGALPLHTACFNGHLDVARWLTTKAKTSKKEALNVQDLQGGTPLHHAALGGSLKLCRWLLFHGADERAGTVDGLTPERVAMEAGEGSQKIVTLLRCHATHLKATEPDRLPFRVEEAAPPVQATNDIDADELEAVAQAEREAEAFRLDETTRLLQAEDARRQAQDTQAAKLVATEVEKAEAAKAEAAAAQKSADDGWLRQYQADQAKKEAERAAAAPAPAPEPAPANSSRFDVRAPAVVPFGDVDEDVPVEAPTPKPLITLDEPAAPAVVAEPAPAPPPAPKRDPSPSPDDDRERKRRRRTSRRRRDDGSESDGSRDRRRRRRRRRDRSPSPEPYNPRRGPPRHQRGPSPASRAAMKQIAEAAKQGTVSGSAALGMYGRAPP